jgi:hypothetical protein
VVVQYHRGHGTLAPLLAVLGQASITVGGIDIEDDDHSTERSVRLGVQGSRRADRSFARISKARPASSPSSGSTTPSSRDRRGSWFAYAERAL